MAAIAPFLEKWGEFFNDCPHRPLPQIRPAPRRWGMGGGVHQEGHTVLARAEC